MWATSGMHISGQATRCLRSSRSTAETDSSLWRCRAIRSRPSPARSKGFSMPFPAVLLTIDRIEYESAWALQRRLVEERRREARADTLMLVEHDPVYTIGRTGCASHWGDDESRLAAQGDPVYHVERGGSITYHGPGQIVGYPILLLSRFCSGPKTYIGLLETVLIRTLEEW